MCILFNLKTIYEGTELKPLKAKEFVCSECLCSLLGFVAGGRLFIYIYDCKKAA